MSPLALEAAGLDATAVYARLATRPDRLGVAEATARLAEHGPNILARDRRLGRACSGARRSIRS